jgi:hypothetical protein
MPMDWKHPLNKSEARERPGLHYADRREPSAKGGAGRMHPPAVSSTLGQRKSPAGEAGLDGTRPQNLMPQQR